jgi:hypothetical protein
MKLATNNIIESPNESACGSSVEYSKFWSNIYGNSIDKVRKEMCNKFFRKKLTISLRRINKR